MTEFLSGASFLAAVAIALFFLRFWRETGDRFFALFALAFAVFSANRVALTFVDAEDEATRTWIYVVRLVAFLLIIAAIVEKNRARE